MEVDRDEAESRNLTESVGEEDDASSNKPPSLEITAAPMETPKLRELGSKPRGLSHFFRRSQAGKRESSIPSHLGDDLSASNERTQSLYSMESSPSTLPDSNDTNSVHSTSSAGQQAPAPLLSGTLSKLSSGLVKKWQTRSFELREAALLLRDPQAPKIPAKSLRFADVIRAEAVPEKKFDKKLVFVVETKEKASYYQATSAGDLGTLLQHLAPSSSGHQSSDH